MDTCEPRNEEWSARAGKNIGGLKKKTKIAYAAVAANTSILRDLVANAKQTQNNSVNTQTRTSLVRGLETHDRTTMDNSGAKHEKTVPSMLIATSMDLVSISYNVLRLSPTDGFSSSIGRGV